MKLTRIDLIPKQTWQDEILKALYSKGELEKHNIILIVRDSIREQIKNIKPKILEESKPIFEILEWNKAISAPEKDVYLAMVSDYLDNYHRYDPSSELDEAESSGLIKCNPLKRSDHYPFDYTNTYAITDKGMKRVVDILGSQ